MAMTGLKLFRSALRASPIFVHPHRTMAARARKRFYKDVHVVHNGSSGSYEICLDHRKLKTPLGKEFIIHNKTLAHAVAQEWLAQKNLVVTSQMHLTGLCNVCIDNPTQTTREEVAKATLNFLDTDTILFFSSDNEALLQRQETEWRPIIDWFNQVHGDLNIRPSTSMLPPAVDPKAKEALTKYLLSYDTKALNGFAFGVDAIKSFILTCAAIDRRISVEEAVKLGRLELEIQTEKWGNVEWAHDLELHDTTARLAAATMFVQLTSSQHLTKEKSIQS